MLNNLEVLEQAIEYPTQVNSTTHLQLLQLFLIKIMTM